MKLVPIIATSVRQPDRTVRSRVLVNMDKFVDAVEDANNLVSLWFEGPFSIAMDKNDFESLLLELGVCKRDVPDFTPGSATGQAARRHNSFQSPGGDWEKHIS